MTIDTVRLQLLSYSREQVLALFEGQAFENFMGVKAAPGMEDFMVTDEVSPVWLAMVRAAASIDPWVHGFAVVDRESQAVIGGAGFKGPPDDDGMVEIAYGIVPNFQGRGLATEAAEALVAFAFNDSQVRLVRAHTAPTPNASTRVLTKCGFQHLGEVVDPEDGLVWRWERAAETA